MRSYAVPSKHFTDLADISVQQGPRPVPFPPAGINRTFNGTTGDDTFTGSNHADVFHMEPGGADTAAGRKGDDTFFFGDAFDANDSIDGGDGFDVLHINGGAAANGGLLLSSAMMLNVEAIAVHGSLPHGFGVTADALPAHHTLTITAAVDFTGTLLVNPNPDVHGTLREIGGNGRDQLVGSRGDDFLDGEGGDDLMGGGAGHDTFWYSSVSDSNNAAIDRIERFDAREDLFDTPSPVDFADGTVHELGRVHSDASLETKVGGTLGAFDAGIFRFNHNTYLIIDFNGTAGYQTGQDFLIHLFKPQHLDELNVANFI